MPKFRFSEGSHASTIIYYIALSGSFPWKSLGLIPGDHTMILRTIRDLRKEGYLIVKDKGEQKTIKIAKKALDILDVVHPGLYDYYMFNSENHTARGAPKNDKAAQFQLIARKHRMAETYCMCNMIDCKVLFSEKPTLSMKYSNKDLSGWLTHPIFYNSREIKSVDPEQQHKTEFSRITGLLISLGGCYNVYNVHKGLIKWNQYGENKAKVLTSDLINSNFSSVFGRDKMYKSDAAIMLAKDFSAAEVFLSSTGSRPDKNGFELISFDNTYPDIYLIPLDIYGALQLKILSYPNWHTRLMNCLFDNYDPNRYSAVDCDNYIDGKYILSLLDGNVARLRRFNQSIYEHSPSEFEVICFPWQTETIKNILDFGVNIVEVGIEDLINVFFG